MLAVKIEIGRMRMKSWITGLLVAMFLLYSARELRKDDRLPQKLAKAFVKLERLETQIKEDYDKNLPRLFHELNQATKLKNEQRIKTCLSKYLIKKNNVADLYTNYNNSLALLTILAPQFRLNSPQSHKLNQLLDDRRKFFEGLEQSGFFEGYRKDELVLLKKAYKIAFPDLLNPFEEIERQIEEKKGKPPAPFLPLMDRRAAFFYSSITIPPVLMSFLSTNPAFTSNTMSASCVLTTLETFKLSGEGTFFTISTTLPSRIKIKSRGKFMPFIQKF